jgi:hypothetical protein
MGQAVVALALMGALDGYAQAGKTMLVVPPAPLLPAKFGPWELEEVAPTCENCIQLDGDAAGVVKEAGLTRSSRLTYHQPGKTETMNVDAFQFEDATGAVSAFTSMRLPEMHGLGATKKVGSDAAATADGKFLILSGTAVVSATTSRVTPGTIDDLRQLVVTLPKIGGPKGAAPLLPTLVPAKGLEAGSVRYALGPVTYAAEGGVLPAGMLGWEKSGEVVTAQYAGGGVLTLLLYPTPQIAGDRGRAIEAAINADRSKYGTVKLRREGPMLALATGGFSAGQEKELVEGIHLPVQLTWDKKMPLEFHAEIGKTYSLLTSIAAFCGVGAAAAIFLGLFLGGGRAAIRVLQGKPAASEPEFLRIDLRGSASPLHSESPQTGPQG